VVGVDQQRRGAAGRRIDQAAEAGRRTARVDEKGVVVGGAHEKHDRPLSPKFYCSFRQGKAIIRNIFSYLGYSWKIYFQAMRCQLFTATQSSNGFRQHHSLHSARRFGNSPIMTPMDKLDRLILEQLQAD